MVYADYNNIEYIMNIYARMHSKSYTKVDIWAIRNLIFEDLGSFGRMLNFNEFCDMQKVKPKV